MLILILAFFATIHAKVYISFSIGIGFPNEKSNKFLEGAKVENCNLGFIGEKFDFPDQTYFLMHDMINSPGIRSNRTDRYGI